MTPIYHFDIVQGTPEWDKIRAGKFSASKAAVIMGGLDTQGLKDYLGELAWGRVFGPTDSGFKSEAMKRGNLVEPESREWYALTKDVLVEECGFVEHGSIPNLGWSPDGLFNKRRNGIEAKNPLHKAWMAVEETRKVPAEYRWQVKFACLVGALDGLDFVCYHPRAGGLIVGVELEPEEQERIEERIALLEPMVQKRVDRLSEYRRNAL